MFNGDDVQAHIDHSVAFDPGEFVSGTRHVSLFTADQTSQIDLAVASSQAGPVRGAVPADWDVLVELSDDIERVEQRDGVQYVHFTSEAAATTTEYTYFVEAPAESELVNDTGRYRFGPVEVLIDGGWVAATTSETTTIGADTDV